MEVRTSNQQDLWKWLPEGEQGVKEKSKPEDGNPTGSLLCEPAGSNKFNNRNPRVRITTCQSMTQYQSVTNLIRHLEEEKSDSWASKRAYCGTLQRFCKEVGMDPDELLHMDKGALEDKIKHYLSPHSRKTANTYKDRLKTFFRVNRRRDIEYPKYYLPSRGGMIRDEYVPTLEEAEKMSNLAGSPKARAVIKFLYTTGLRSSTLRALKYGENPYLQFSSIREEIEKNQENLLIVVHPNMKETIPEACKNRIFYYTFTPKETTEALKDYLNERKRKYGTIADDELLFPSESKKLPKEERTRTPMTERNLQKIVRKAAERAGLKNWKHVTPKSLRKTYESALRNQSPDVRLDTKDQEFFMGHVLSGVQENYHDHTKVEEMREKLSKLDFSPGKPQAQDRKFLTELAKFLGIDYEKVLLKAKERCGGEPGEDDIRAVMRDFIKGNQEVIPVEELETYLNNGWKYVNNTPDGRVVISKPMLGLDTKEEVEG